jgi:[methyl-Co(III) methanol-specific corrinoid protein]:coenzyme M methyltransferase
MDYIAGTGLAAFHYDSKNAPAESMEIVEDRIALIGNINNPETLYARGPEQVAAEVLANLDAGVPLVGPECAIPLQTALENLKEIPLTVKRWHAEQLDLSSGDAATEPVE